MNRIGAFFGVLLTACLLCLTSSCSGPSVFRSGGSGGTTPPPGGGGNNGQVNIALTTAITPIPGITVLSFDVSVIGMQLISSTGAVVTLRSPSTAQRIEFTHLQTDSVFMGSFPVLPGTFNSLNTTFEPLTMTILNQTGATVLGTCPNNFICEISPSVLTGSITVTSSPFPLTIATGLQTGIQLTFDIGNLIKPDATLDFTRAGILSAVKLPLPGQPAGQFTSFDDQVGRVTGLNTSTRSFTFQSARSIFDVKIDPATTLFDGFGGCVTADINCLRNDQSVSIDAGINGDGTFVAREIQFEDPLFDEEVEGTIFAIDSPTQFEMVITTMIQGSTNFLRTVDVSSPIVVQLRPGAKFEVDTKGFMVQLASVNQFQNATDTSQLFRGQDVEARITGTGTPSTFASFTTDRVRLRFTRVTGHARPTIASASFNIGDLPRLFGASLPVQVQTFTTGPRVTVFENLAGVSALSDGDTVAIKALLIGNSAPPFFAAKVRKR